MCSSVPEEHDHRSGAALRRPRGGECHHVVATAQQAVGERLQHGAGGLRAQALAVDDAHAVQVALARLGEEARDGGLCGGGVHLVQVDLVLHAELAALELAQQLRRITVAQVAQFLAYLERSRVESHVQQLAWHSGLVGLEHARQRRGFRYRRRCRDRIDAAHLADRLAEQAGVVFADRRVGTAFHGPMLASGRRCACITARETTGSLR